ncbi:hypothetical protein RM553_19635, partial [Zunongwangia sp. F363]
NRGRYQQECAEIFKILITISFLIFIKILLYNVEINSTGSAVFQFVLMVFKGKILSLALKNIHD